ncbi:hypothetical protein EDD18DRAFT_87804 [Armillaria luteobubalina]|uniref:Uncharacterized protein n=1 Tax=Armillaria luteobubalina TaxID=153913 RepID=A0AA39Q8U3_9AGAR|nr:hypothetical protein EDD18DRAFT_87804 [Armillaria luteobubalina]
MTSSLFSGLCFGDISLSQESSSSMHAATLPDIPNSTVTPGCGDRDVTPPVVYDNTSHSPSRANYLDDFDPAGHCLDGDILPTDPEDDREYPLPDTVSLSQNACVFAIASVDAEPIELGQGAYSQPHDPAVHAEPLVVLSAGNISNFNILDPDMNGEQIQPDAYSDILSASLQADSLHSDYIGFHCSPDQGLAAEITRNASQNSHYDLHCANEPVLSVASADSDLLTSSQILLERIVRDTDIIQFPSEAALYSSPPCSSPAKIFSSSPPLSSQTSASTEPSPEETEVSKQTLETVHNYDDQSQLISSNASEQAWNEVSIIEMDVSDVHRNWS